MRWYLFLCGGFVGWASSSLYLIPAHDREYRRVDQDRIQERVQRVKLEILLDAQRDQVTARDAEIDRLRRALIHQRDPLGVLAAERGLDVQPEDRIPVPGAPFPVPTQP
jgi:hypothetical protein